MRTVLKISVVALAGSVAASAALAGGFDRGGVNVDLLFSKERMSTEATGTFVSPQRKIENVQRASNAGTSAAVAALLAPVVGAAGPLATAEEIGAFIALDPANNSALVTAVTNGVVAGIAIAGGNPAPDTDALLDVDSDFFVPRLSAKFSLSDDAACLATYTKPFGANADYGQGNAYSASAVSFSVDSDDIGLTCAYRFTGPELGIGQSYFRFLGGVSYQELSGSQTRQSFLDFANLGQTGIGGVTNTSGLGRFDVSGDAIGYRIGAAFEIPDIALRAQLIYSSKYDYKLTGFQDNSGFGATIPGSILVPISMSTEIPQSLEFKLQTGIAEDTLGFVSVKWQEWSKLGIIPIVGAISPLSGQPTNLSFDPVYKDGWTVTAGVGRKLTEFVSASAAVTWDRGTATISGTQTDTWNFSGGVVSQPNENVEFRLGGSIGILTSGTSIPVPGGDSANAVTYSFGTDVVTAISSSVKLKF